MATTSKNEPDSTIINNILDIPIFSNTNRLYDFEDQNTCK